MTTEALEYERWKVESERENDNKRFALQQAVIYASGAKVFKAEVIETLARKFYGFLAGNGAAK